MSSEELLAEVEEQVLADVAAAETDASADLPSESPNTHESEEGKGPLALVLGEAFTDLPPDLLFHRMHWKLSWRPSRALWICCYI